MIGFFLLMLLLVRCSCRGSIAFFPGVRVPHYSRSLRAVEVVCLVAVLCVKAPATYVVRVAVPSGILHVQGTAIQSEG